MRHFCYYLSIQTMSKKRGPDMKPKSVFLGLVLFVFFFASTGAYAAGWQDLIKPAPKGEFQPIPVSMVYPPVKSNASCQEQLDSGKVVDTTFERTPSAKKVWKIRVLFPH